MMISQEEELKKDRNGNFILSIDFSLEEKKEFFDMYLNKNNYSQASICLFDDIYNETSNLDKAISDTILNQIIIDAIITQATKVNLNEESNKE